MADHTQPTQDRYLWIISRCDRPASEAIEHASSDTSSVRGGKRPTSFSQRFTHRVQQCLVIYCAGARRSKSCFTLSKRRPSASFSLSVTHSVSRQCQMQHGRDHWQREACYHRHNTCYLALEDVIKFLYRVHRAWKRFLASCQSFNTYVHSCLPPLFE